MNVAAAAASIWDAQNHHHLSREEESQEDHFLSLSFTALWQESDIPNHWWWPKEYNQTWLKLWIGWMDFFNVILTSPLLLLSSYVASSGASSSSSSNFIPKFIIIDGHQPTTSLLALSNCRYLIGKPFSYFNKFLNYLLGTATSKKIKVIENSQMLVDKIL